MARVITWPRRGWERAKRPTRGSKTYNCNLEFNCNVNIYRVIKDMNSLHMMTN